MNKQSCFSYCKWVAYSLNPHKLRKKTSNKKQTDTHEIQTPNQMNECNDVDIVSLLFELWFSDLSVLLDWLKCWMAQQTNSTQNSFFIWTANSVIWWINCDS